MKQKLKIVMYHYIRDLQNSRYPQIKGLEYSLFKEQILFLKENYHVIRMEDLLNKYKQNIDLPDNALLLTFDDGYIDHYTYVMPVLLECGLQGSFFIPGKIFSEHVLLDVNKIHFILASQNEFVLIQDLNAQLNYYRGVEFPIPSNRELWEQYAVANRFDTKETIFVKRILQTGLPERLRQIISSNLFHKYMNGIKEDIFARELYVNYDQIKCMHRCGMYIGPHGYDHYWLGKLPVEDMKSDILKGLASLEELIDKKAWVMNYPYGSYNDDTINFLQTTGCKAGISTEVRIADIETDNRYILPRLDTNDFPPKSANYRSYE